MNGLAGGVELLERALGYTYGALGQVTEESLGCPTPCTDWDLAALLQHVGDSFDVLSQGIRSGAVPPGQSDVMPGRDVVGAVRARAGDLLGGWTAASGDRVLAIGDMPLMASSAAGVGAVEIAVHGWDIFRALGQPRPIPPGLAEDLLEIARLTVGDTGRHPLFAAAVSAPNDACPSDRLAAYLGRSPA